jgi:myo-inositol-1(or 4)-monophosphatase
MQDRIQLAMELARRAGGLLLEGQTTSLQVSRKGPNDLVTDYDLKSEQMLVKGILEAYPEDRILAEEGTNNSSGGAQAAGQADAEHLWLIDPIDGTTNYAHGVPFYSVSIGVMANKQLLIGVVYDPTRDELFHASDGGGAWLGDRPLKVSETRTLEESLLVTGFPYDIKTNPNNNLDHYSVLAKLSRGVRRLGSAALDLAYVAAGRLDGYWELTLSPWDWAAGVLLVREAGGTVTTFDGGDKVIGGDETLLATNAHLHGPLQQVLLPGI